MNVSDVQAGPELDERMAEMIEPKPSPLDQLDTGLLSRVLRRRPPRSPKDAWFVRTSGYYDGDRLFWAPRPFSSSIEAAWQIVEHWEGDVRIDHQNKAWKVEFFEPSMQYSAWAETAALAICRAALAALSG